MAINGVLYLIPTHLGGKGEDALQVLPPHTVGVLYGLRTFIAERARTARRFIKALGHPLPIAELQVSELNKHAPTEGLEAFLEPAIAGEDIGLLSEAGCPAVADPGAHLVALAHKKGIRVYPLVGPSAILLALMASGLNGQCFAFQGYLPIKGPERAKALRRLESVAAKNKQTQLFIEAPYRNDGLIKQSLSVLAPDTRFCIAANLTLPTQFVRTDTIAGWKKKGPPSLDKQPTVFLLYR